MLQPSPWFQALLEASGKVKRSKASQRKASSSKKKTDKANDSCDERSTTKVEDRVIEEFFEVIQLNSVDA